MSADEQRAEIDGMRFLSFPSEKRGEVVLAFECGSLNIQLMNVASESIHDGTLKGFNAVLPFTTYLGERMALALNCFAGKTNAEIKAVSEKGCVNESFDACE